MQVLLQFIEKISGNHDLHNSGTVQENREQFKNTGTCFRKGCLMRVHTVISDH